MHILSYRLGNLLNAAGTISKKRAQEHTVHPVFLPSQMFWDTEDAAIVNMVLGSVVATLLPWEHYPAVNWLN